MLTFVVFVVVFGGMIFIHEFGHFIVARIFNIPVEEFGFGIPPRAWRFWRNKGHLVIGGQKVMIPANYDLPFHWQDGMYEQANATVDEIDGKLVLRSIQLVRSERAQEDMKSIAEMENTPSGGLDIPAAKPVTPGAIALSGALSEVEPGMEWTINWLPLGGFVRPRGENDPTVPGGLAAVNPWKRIAVLVAGPFMNLLTAVVVCGIIIAQSGIPIPDKVLITEVSKNSPAEQAGIQANDVVTQIANTQVEDPDHMIILIRSNLDKPINIVVERNGQTLTLNATPLSARIPRGEGALGVGVGYATQPATPSEVITGSFVQTGVLVYGLASLPVGLLQGSISPEEARFVGLKGIYDFFGVAIKRDTESRAAITPPVTQPDNSNQQPISTPTSSQKPTNAVLGLIAMLSVSLGVFNLMPIPALDGGRILFTLPEILFRRRIPTHLENTVNGVAFLLLIGLMLVVNVMDFINPATLP